MMAKYRKLPVVIEAFRYKIDPYPDWFMEEVKTQRIARRNDSSSGDYCEIKTLEGTMIGYLGDYIVRGIKGEIYPCAPDIFESTYERVEQNVHESN